MNQPSHILKLFLISLVGIVVALSAVYFILWAMVSVLGVQGTIVTLVLGWSAFIVTAYLWAEGY